MKKVTIIIGSESDKGVADKAIEVLEKFNVPYTLEVASAHREPNKVREIVQSSDADVFICIAGLSAALPGFVASITPKPVIGVPVNVKLGGLDSLLSISQMPAGIPVATMGIDNGKNAAYYAIRILGLKYPEALTGEASTYTEPRVPIPGISETSSAESDLKKSISETPNFSGFPMFSESGASKNESSTSIKEEKEKARGDWL